MSVREPGVVRCIAVDGPARGSEVRIVRAPTPVRLRFSAAGGSHEYERRTVSRRMGRAIYCYAGRSS